MTEIVPGVFKIKRTFGSNVFIVSGRVPTVVDAGFPMDSRRVVGKLRTIAPDSRIEMVATHYHLDHTGSITAMKESFDMSVSAHCRDAPVMEGTEPYETFEIDPWRRAYYRTLSPLFKYKYCRVDRWLREGDLVETPLGELEVIHLPGHTKGSIALFQADRGILFSGDNIRNEGGVLEGPPAEFTPHPQEALRAMEEKIVGLSFQVLLPGHGEPLPCGADRAVKRMIEKKRFGDGNRGPRGRSL